jgi:hypothetical protein
MEEKMTILKQNHTWEQALKPKGVKPITNKWVYKVKTQADDSIERYKAGLVARAFSQRYGLDYDETFSQDKLKESPSRSYSKQHDDPDGRGVPKLR